METVRTGLDGAANANCQPQSNQGRDNDSRDKQNKGDNDPQDGCASKIGGWGIDSNAPAVGLRDGSIRSKLCLSAIAVLAEPGASSNHIRLDRGQIGQRFIAFCILNGIFLIADAFQIAVGNGVAGGIQHISCSAFTYLEVADNLVKECFLGHKVDHASYPAPHLSILPDWSGNNDRHLTGNRGDQWLGDISVPLHCGFEIGPVAVI